MASVPLGLIYLLLPVLVCEGVTSSLYFCSSTDPCFDANQTSLFEPYARYEVCQYDQSYNFCDRYIDPKWYRVDDPLLGHCPPLGSCGALYPLWLNGTLPLQSEGIVTRTACKVGFNDCCVKEYTIQIKNCSTYQAYCLGALDSCADRYCFGVNGSCDVPTTKQTTDVTVTSPESKTPACYQDPCFDGFVRTLKDPIARSENCKYDSDNTCDRYLEPDWYRVDSRMLDHCPDILSCGTVYPVWLNGSIPNFGEGVVSRKACKKGFSDCCADTYDILIKNCGAYIAYCLSELNGCPERYCFGENESCERKSETTQTKDDEKITDLVKILIAILTIMTVLFITLLVYWKCSTKGAVDGKMVSPQKSNAQCRSKSPPPTYDYVIKMKEKNAWMK